MKTEAVALVAVRADLRSCCSSPDEADSPASTGQQSLAACTMAAEYSADQKSGSADSRMLKGAARRAMWPRCALPDSDYADVDR